MSFLPPPPVPLPSIYEKICVGEVSLSLMSVEFTLWKFSVKKRVQEKLKLVPHKRVKSLEESGHAPVCRYCWMIVRPNVVRHAKSWTKDFEKCMAEGNANCTGVDENDIQSS